MRRRWRTHRTANERNAAECVKTANQGTPDAVAVETYHITDDCDSGKKALGPCRHDFLHYTAKRPRRLRVQPDGAQCPLSD